MAKSVTKTKVSEAKNGKSTTCVVRSTDTGKFVSKTNGKSDDRAEKRKALALKAFRMVYDSHHKKG